MITGWVWGLAFVDFFKFFWTTTGLFWTAMFEYMKEFRGSIFWGSDFIKTLGWFCTVCENCNPAFEMSGTSCIGTKFVGVVSIFWLVFWTTWGTKIFWNGVVPLLPKFPSYFSSNLKSNGNSSNSDRAESEKSPFPLNKSLSQLFKRSKIKKCWIYKSTSNIGELPSISERSWKSKSFEAKLILLSSISDTCFPSDFIIFWETHHYLILSQKPNKSTVYDHPMFCSQSK